MGDIFNLVAAKLLFIIKRVRPEIDQTVAYICMRATKSDKGDWRILRSLMNYLKKTIDDVSIIGSNGVE